MLTLPNDIDPTAWIVWSQNHLGLGFAKSLAMLSRIRLDIMTRTPTRAPHGSYRL